ncbi:hypothetical protein [Candidatus Nitrospira bockiana]
MDHSELSRRMGGSAKKTIVIIKRPAAPPPRPAAGDSPLLAPRQAPDAGHSAPPRPPASAPVLQAVATPRWLTWCRQPASWAIVGGLTLAVLGALVIVRLIERLPAQTRRSVTAVSAPAPAAEPTPVLRTADSAQMPREAHEPDGLPRAPIVRPKFPAAFQGEVRVYDQLIVRSARQLSASLPGTDEAEARERPGGGGGRAPQEIGAAALFRGRRMPNASEGAGPRSTGSERSAESRPLIPLGLRYTIERTGRGGAPRLSIEANQDGYVSLWGRDTDDLWRRLSPPEHDDVSTARVEQGQRYVLAPKRDAEPDGVEASPVVLVLSRHPEPHAWLAGRADPGMPGQPFAALFGRPFHREEVEEPSRDGRREKVVYVVEAEPHPSSHLVIDPSE